MFLNHQKLCIILVNKGLYKGFLRKKLKNCLLIQR